jgi:predicted nucleic acid-binding protein
VIILDTNVISELMKPEPSRKVFRWVSRQSPLELFTTTISQAEVLYGIALLPKGKRRNLLQAAAESMFAEDFRSRILAFDEDAARLFPEIVIARRSMGHPIAVLDAEIVAIARSRGSVVATRDTRGFGDCGVTVVNPWM